MPLKYALLARRAALRLDRHLLAQQLVERHVGSLFSASNSSSKLNSCEIRLVAGEADQQQDVLAQRRGHFQRVLGLADTFPCRTLPDCAAIGGHITRRYRATLPGGCQDSVKSRKIARKLRDFVAKTAGRVDRYADPGDGLSGRHPAQELARHLRQQRARQDVVDVAGAALDFLAAAGDGRQPERRRSRTSARWFSCNRSRDPAQLQAR